MMTKFKKRFLCFVIALISVIYTVTPMSAIATENYANGGWAIVKDNTSVVNENGVHIGTVYAMEGVTVLSVNGTTAHIEYATSGNPKNGYVSTSSFYQSNLSSTSVAIVKTSCSTYYSPSTALYAGSVNNGELVVVIASNGSWDYIEYNTSKGRKRAYVRSSNLNWYNTTRNIPNFYQVTGHAEPMSVGARTTVYSGPSEKYKDIGYVLPTDKIYFYNAFWVNNGLDAMLYISYPASNNQTKYGYIYVRDFF